MLTLRNWVIGFYLAEYEQLGADRAVYGAKLYRTLAQKLKEKKIKGLSFTNLHLYKKFYQTYPQIVQTLSEQLKLPNEIAEKIKTHVKPIDANPLSLDINLLIKTKIL